MSDAFVSALPDGAVEVSLRPEELGRVRLVLTPDAAGLSVTLQAERPETLDQMRRAIDTLAADLRDLGYSGLSFRFDRPGHQGGRSGGERVAPEDRIGTEPAVAPVPVAMAAGSGARLSARLDIRL